MLALIKMDERLRSIPTIILSSTEAQADIEKSYYLHANCHLRKPAELGGFERLATNINDFWGSAVSMPGRSAVWRIEERPTDGPPNAAGIDMPLELPGKH